MFGKLTNGFATTVKVKGANLDSPQKLEDEKANVEGSFWRNEFDEVSGNNDSEDALLGVHGVSTVEQPGSQQSRVSTCPPLIHLSQSLTS